MQARSRVRRDFRSRIHPPCFFIWTILSSISSFTFELRDVGDAFLGESLSPGHYLKFMLQTVMGYQLQVCQQNLYEQVSFDVEFITCHLAPCYLNSEVFLLLSKRYRNPERGFEPRSLSECLLEFDTRSKPLGRHSRLIHYVVAVPKVHYVVLLLQMLLIVSQGLGTSAKRRLPKCKKRQIDIF